MNNLITSGKHADIFKDDLNKQNQAFQKMADFINNPDLLWSDAFE